MTELDKITFSNWAGIVTTKEPFSAIEEVIKLRNGEL